MWLTRLSIARPVTILMLVLTLVILGLTSHQPMPVDLYPNVDFPMLFITTVYPGTGPEEMETLVTKPIEDQRQHGQRLEEAHLDLLRGRLHRVDGVRNSAPTSTTPPPTCAASWTPCAIRCRRMPKRRW